MNTGESEYEVTVKLNYLSALKAGYSLRAAGKFNAELGSIVWIVLSP